MMFDRPFTNLLLFFVVLLPGYGVTLAGQQLEDIVELFDKYQNENYEELIYVQTDKNYYLAGERIKVKINCLEKSTTTLSRLSKVAYIEVLTSDNSPQIQGKIELVNGSGSGELYIPTSVNSGNFVLRAYTKWMRNYGPDGFFHSGIVIVNPFKRLGLQPISHPDDPSIQFFPESKELINGVKTRVVFDTQHQQGEGAAFKGRLIAEDSLIVSEFKPDILGMGYFELVPDINQKYQVELEHSDGSKSQHSFLPVHEKGVSLTVEKMQSSLRLNIFCNDPALAPSSDVLLLLLHQKGKVLAKKEVPLKNGLASVELDAIVKKDGIATMTIFSSNGSFLKQRNFLHSYTDRSRQITVDKPVILHREEAEIDLSDFFNNNSTDIADVAISISTFQEDLGVAQLTLDQNFLINNHLNSEIFRIGKVFEENTENAPQLINNLLIAYSRVDTSWLNDQKNKKKYVPEYRTPLITGKVINKETKEPEFGLNAYISVVGKNIQFNSTRSRNDGSIVFEMPNLYSSNELVVQTDYTKDTIYSIEIDDPFSSEYIDVNVPMFNIDENLENWITQQSQYMQVRNAYSRYQPKLPFLSQIDTSVFYNSPDARYYLDDFTRFIVMEEVMREYISGVNVRKNKDGFHFMMIDLERNEVYDQNPLILLDGVPIFDADDIISLDPLKIEKIETVKRRFHKGYLDCFGILSITSYKGNLDGYDLNRHAKVIKYEGLQMARQYHFPSYSTANQKGNTSPDFRDVLYWNPQLRLANESEKKVTFYSSDETNSYQITINALTEDGQAYSGKAIINVLPEEKN